MKNKMVTLLCIMTILITTAVVTFANQDTIRREIETDTSPESADLIEQMINGQADYSVGNDIVLNPGYDMDYLVNVTNVTASTPVYVRTVIAFESAGLEIDAFHEALNIVLDQNWSYTSNNEYISMKLDGVDYYMLVATYPASLNGGQTTPSNLLSIGFESAVSSEIAALFGEEYSIMVESQAVQTDGWANNTGSLDDINEILNIAFGKITSTNHPFDDN